MLYILRDALQTEAFSNVASNYMFSQLLLVIALLCSRYGAHSALYVHLDYFLLA
jgi:hypothetical protein